jgi:hypothetical protein
MTRRLATALVVMLAGSFPAGSQEKPLAPPPVSSTITQLDRYARGEFDAVVEELSNVENFKDTFEALRADGPAWIESAGTGDRDRRELAAATFALEASRLGQWTAWKEVWLSGDVKRVTWMPPAQLLEWACERMRQRPASPINRIWFLASVAIAERSEDVELLVGLDGRLQEDIVQHVRHAQKSYPKEPRFSLAYGIGEEWHDTGRARRYFLQLVDDPDVGAEALLRLGHLALRDRNHNEATERLGHAERRSRDPWIVHLARLFLGQSYDMRNRLPDAEREYRVALTAIPRAQSASFALAGVLFRAGQQTEAASVADAALTASLSLSDPWREYAHGDARFWPQLIARLRTEIRR